MLHEHKYRPHKRQNALNDEQGGAWVYISLRAQWEHGHQEEEFEFEGIHMKSQSRLPEPPQRMTGVVRIMWV